MLPPKIDHLSISKLQSILAVANLLAHINISLSQICCCSQISLQSAAVNCSFSDNLTPLGVPFILLASVHSAAVLTLLIRLINYNNSGIRDCFLSKY